LSLGEKVSGGGGPSKDEDPLLSSASAESRNINRILAALIFLNITTKGSISVYETMGMQIATGDYFLSSITFGFIITICGTIGFIQLLFFKYCWTSRFSDLQLILGGIVAMTFGQLLFFPFWGQESTKESFILCIVLFYAIGYPIGVFYLIITLVLWNLIFV